MKLLLPLALLAVALDVLVPTALPVRLDGLPLNTLPELAVVELAVVVGLCALVSLLCRRTGALRAFCPSTTATRASTVASAALLVCGCCLLLLHLAVPRGDGIATCYMPTTTAAGGCAFDANDVFDRGSGVSTYERAVDFDASRQAFWPLGAFNSADFNFMIGDDPNARSTQQLPFSAIMTLRADQLDHLAQRFGPTVEILMHYRGRLDLRLNYQSNQTVEQSYPFSMDAAHQVWMLDLVGIQTATLRYANYDCASTSGSQCNAVSFQKASLLLQLQSATGGTAATLSSNLLRAPSLDALNAVAQALEFVVLVLCGFLTAIAVADPLWRVSRLLAPVRVEALRAVLPSLLVTGVALWAGYLIAQQVTCTVPIIFDGICDRSNAVISVAALMPAWIALSTPSAGRAIGGCVRVLGNRVVYVCVGLPLFMAMTFALGSAPTQDSVTVLHIGDDPLTYYDWSRRLLETGSFPDQGSSLVTTLLSKPLFPVLRAALFVLFGDGTEYAAHLITSVLMIAPVLVAAVASLVVLERFSTEPSASPPLALRCVALLGAGFSVASLSMFETTWAAVWSVGFSEAPSWALIVLATSIVGLAAIAQRRVAFVLLIVSFVLAAGVGVRSLSIALLPPIVVFVPLIVAGRFRIRDVFFLVWPILAGAVVLVGFLILFGNEVIQYIVYNSGPQTFGRSMSFGALMGDARRLVINLRYASAFVPLIIVLAINIISEYRSARSDGRRRPLVTLGAFVLAILVFGFATQLPLLDAPYYPRPIALTYMCLPVFGAMLWVLRVTRGAPRPHGAAPPSTEALPAR